MAELRGKWTMHDRREQHPVDPDAALMGRIAARRSDPSSAADALCTLYSRYSVPIRRYLLFLTRDQGYAEELQQDVFLAAWLGAGTYDGRASVNGWLHAIARRRTRDGRRRHRLELVDDACLVETASADPPPEQVAMCRMELEAIRSAIEDLKPQHREVLTLAAQGLSMRDLAAVLDVPVGTVKRWLFEARQALGRAVEERDR
jgi:RNA polymerase sigma-70 factor (ECF subfamily)